MKRVRPVYLMDGDGVHYLWRLSEPLKDEIRGHLDLLRVFARSIVALGWGIDVAVGDAGILSEDEAAALPGERWLPGGPASEGGLRVPISGTLADLDRRHAGFLHRLGTTGLDSLTPPPPLSVFATVEYRRATDPARLPLAVFAIRKLDGSGFRPFGTASRALTVAGMTRHAVRIAAEVAGWPDARIASVVLGHAAQASEGDEQRIVGAARFAYLPVPSLEARGTGHGATVGSVRRVMITSFDPACEPEVRWAAQVVAGRQLVQEVRHQPVAVLAPLPSGDHVTAAYTRSASSWATVTPVVLPGYDDPAHYRRRLNREAPRRTEAARPFGG